MQAECIGSESGMRALLPEWSALWRLAPNAMPFQSPGWLMAWWKHFGTDAPRVLSVRAGGRLAGVLPLYELAEPGCRKLLPIGIGLSDYIDGLVDPATPAAADCLLAAVLDIRGWDECHLPDLPEGGVLQDVYAPPDLAEDRQDGGPCPVLALPDSAAALETIVPRKTLRDVRQAASRAAASGGVRIERAEGDTVSSMLDDLFRLHEARWRLREEPGVLGDPVVQAFHRDAARALGAAGMLRLYRMWVGDAVAAVYYGFAWRGHSYAYIGGFDPEMPRLSPGAQILRHAIGEAIEEGCAQFHFLRGGEGYKYAWGATDRPNMSRTWRR